MNIMNQGACVLLWSLAVFSVVAAEEQSTQGPGCKREECVPVAECPPLRELLLQSPTEDSFKEIRKLTCFVKKTRPWVCCPSTPPPSPPSRRRSSKLRQSLLPNDCGKSNYIPVFEGEGAPLKTYPWKAVLQYRVISEKYLLTNRVYCSGSVINERYVLIPAQCVAKNMTEDLGIELVEVLLGEWDISTDPDCTNLKGKKYCAPPVQRFAVEEVTIHPDFFKRGIISDDIALLRLSRPIDFKASGGFIQPVCLPRAGISAEAVFRDGAFMNSWNSSLPRPSNHILSYVDKTTCDRVLRDTYVKEQICMQVGQGQPDYTAARGAPLMVTDSRRRTSYTQYGILIAKPKGTETLPGLFTYIPPYMQWIEGTLRP
ncbi:CLIP domain-containing serine protease B9-like [Penaeus indicus]|uniref:CLIP domain-containing serine protease B9-like n=1 Tax=Penaeus indicus TaxID=29960 RepID=UPI00300D30BB